jgi:hypothetical protein
MTSTMEPCPLCFGAIVMGNLRHMRFAARDRYAGATALNTRLPYIESKKIRVEGPHSALEPVQIAMQTCFELEHHSPNRERLFADWTADCPIGVEVGRQLFQDGILQAFRNARVGFPEVFEKISTMLPLGNS